MYLFQPYNAGESERFYSLGTIHEVTVDEKAGTPTIVVHREGQETAPKTFKLETRLFMPMAALPWPNDEKSANPWLTSGYFYSSAQVAARFLNNLIKFNDERCRTDLLFNSKEWVQSYDKKDDITPRLPEDVKDPKLRSLQLLWNRGEMGWAVLDKSIKDDNTSTDLHQEILDTMMVRSLLMHYVESNGICKNYTHLLNA